MLETDPELRPYPGIRPFQKSEWPIFFGRERMIDAVLQKLAESQFVLLHGTSGCGKSSLVKAGLLPRLEATHYGEGKVWRTAQMRPGGSPLWNLAEAIARLVADLSDDEEPPLDIVRPIRRRLNRGEHAFEAIQEEFSLGQDGNVCLLVDQFEELFRYATQIERSEVEMFIRVLQAFDETPPNGIHVIATMRSDFVGDCAQFIGFAEVVNRTQYLLPRLEERELMDSIRRPAELFGGEIEVPLAVKLVEESRAEVDALPLVQHCLMYLWNKAEANSQGPEDKTGRTIGLDTFLGLKETLSQRADEILTELRADHPESERCAEHLFRAIIELDGEGRATRRPMRLSTLHEICHDATDTLDLCINRFADPDIGFIVVSRDEDPIVDITHESLIRCWDRLSAVDRFGVDGRPEGWLQRERDDARLWRSLSARAEEEDGLIGSGVLREREHYLKSLPGAAWAARYGGHWNEVHDLLARSRLAADAEAEAARQRRAREQQMLYGALGALVVFIGLSITAYQFYRSANSNLDLFQASETRYLVADWTDRRQNALRDPDIGQSASDVRSQIGLYYLANASFDVEREANLPARLKADFDTLERDFRVALEAQAPVFEFSFSDDEMDGVAVSPDGRWIAAGADNGEIGLWDLSAEGGPKLVQSDAMRTAHSDQVGQVRFNPVGEEFVSVGYDGKACVWDTESLEPVRCLDAPGRNWGADWSADGRWIAAGADRGTARIWDWDTPDSAPISFTTDSELAMGVAFNADAAELAIAPLQAGIQVHTIAGEVEQGGVRMVGQGEFFSVEWSEDGRYIASGLDDGVVIVWDQDGNEIVRMSNREAARGLAFSHDSRFLATGSDAGEARVWAIPSGELVAELRGHQDDVDSIAWTPDGTHIVTGTDRGVLRMFEFKAIETSRPLMSVLEDAKQRLLADQTRCIGEDKWAQLMPDEGLPDWCLSERDRIDKLISEIAEARPDEEADLAQSLNGLDNQEKIFEALEVATLNLQITPNDSPARKDVARRYTRFARSLGVSNDDQLAARLALLEFQIERTAEDSKEVAGLVALEALSRSTLPTGSQLASSASALQVFAQPTARFVLPDDQSRVRSLSLYSPGGLLAVAMESGRVQLWDYVSQSPLQNVNSGLGAAAYQVAFDPSGTRVAIAFQDERFAIWPFPEDMWTLIADVKIPRSVGWSRSGRYLATGGDDEVARVWDMENSEGPPSAIVLQGHSGGVRDLALSGSGARLLTGSNDATARLWDTQTQQLLYTFPRDAAVEAVAYSPDETILAIGGADDRVEIRNAETGDLLRTLNLASNVNDVAFSADGRWLAVASTRASVWDVTTGARRLTLNGDAIASVAWEGENLLVGSTQGEITKWAFDSSTLEGAVDALIKRCLTPEERSRLGLPAEAPEWCSNIGG